MIHESEPGALEPDSDGWFWARCSCGWEQGPFPDLETTVDALMHHALAVAMEEKR